MINQLRLMNSIFKMEIRTILAYRVSFWINFLGTSLGQLVLSFFLWTAIFQSSPNKKIGGMSFSMMILYSILAPMTNKAVSGLQMLDMNQDIYTGSLNKFIIYPVNYFQFKWVQQITQTFSRLLQLSMAIIVFAVFIKAPEDFHFSFINIPLFIINVLISSSLFFLMESLMELAAFWAENVWSLSVLLRFLIGLFSGAWLSLSLFPAWSQTIMSILPFKGMVYIPVRLLMGEVSFSEWLYVQFISMSWILIMGFIVTIVWRRGRVLYTGVGI